jgi:hypothetical protein
MVKGGQATKDVELLHFCRSVQLERSILKA